MPNNRAGGFRYIFSNAFSMHFGDNDVNITFAIMEDAETAVYEDQIGVMMTPKSAKILMIALQNAVRHHEGVAGPIEISAEKLESLNKPLKLVEVKE